MEAYPSYTYGIRDPAHPPPRIVPFSPLPCCGHLECVHQAGLAQHELDTVLDVVTPHTVRIRRQEEVLGLHGCRCRRRNHAKCSQTGRNGSQPRNVAPHVGHQRALRDAVAEPVCLPQFHAEIVLAFLHVGHNWALKWLVGPVMRSQQHIERVERVAAKAAWSASCWLPPAHDATCAVVAIVHELGDENEVVLQQSITRCMGKAPGTSVGE